MHLDITDHGIDDETAEILEHAVIVTTVLAQLTNLDGRPADSDARSGSERDLAVAELVLALLQEQEIRQPLSRAVPLLDSGRCRTATTPPSSCAALADGSAPSPVSPR